MSNDYRADFWRISGFKMIVSCAEDADNMKQQLAWLGLRHVNFNVKPRYVCVCVIEREGWGCGT